MRRILALSLRAILILRAAFCTRIVIFVMAGERDFSGVKYRLDLRGFKFEDEKFHKAAE